MTSPRREPADAAAVDVLLRELEMAPRACATVDSGDARASTLPAVRGMLAVGPIEYRFALGADAPRARGRRVHARRRARGRSSSSGRSRCSCCAAPTRTGTALSCRTGRASVARVEVRGPGRRGRRRSSAAARRFALAAPAGFAPRAPRSTTCSPRWPTPAPRPSSTTPPQTRRSARSAAQWCLVPRDPAKRRASCSWAARVPVRAAVDGDVVVVRTAPTRAVGVHGRGLAEALAPERRCARRRVAVLRARRRDRGAAHRARGRRGAARRARASRERAGTSAPPRTATSTPTRWTRRTGWPRRSPGPAPST